MAILGEVTAVLFARRAAPGLVKTRLMEGGAFTAEAAAAIAGAMMQCTMARLAAAGRLILAVSPDGCGRELLEEAGVHGASTTDQGSGSLGERIDRVWRRLPPERPVAFFGTDTPDVPERILAQIPDALSAAEAAAGPSPDGGYWTLASRRYQPALLAGIDWGSASVYDHTVAQAARAGLTWRALPAWPDVDRPEDVAGLRRRLASLPASPGLSIRSLRRLARRLEILCGEPALQPEAL